MVAMSPSGGLDGGGGGGGTRLKPATSKNNSLNIRFAVLRLNVSLVHVAPDED